MKSRSIPAILLAAAMLFTAGGCGASGASASAGGTGYPKKAVTLIVPYSAGGACDLISRKLAALMEPELGASITVVNQGGASGSIGIQACLDAPADGYTMVMTGDSLGTLRVMGLSETIDYTDFSPIAITTNDPKVFVVGKDSGYDTMQALLDDMKARPGKVKMSYTGPGGSGHVQSLILNALGYEMALTAYPGGSDCILSVLGGQVDFTNSNYSTVISYIESGDLKVLGVCSDARISALPDTPAIVELIPEAKDYLKFPFCPFILQVSKNTDPQIVETLREAAKKAMATDEWTQYVEAACQEKLYEMYPDEASIYGFFGGFESLVSWMLYDAGAASVSPEKFGIARP